MKKVVVFDFDGVLIDSVDELALSSYSTLTGAPYYTLESLPKGYLSLFQRYRYYIQPASDGVVLAQWCVEHANNGDARLGRDVFVTAREEFPLSIGERRDKLFAMREKIYSHDEKQWLAIHRVYEPLWSRIKATAPGSFYIGTNKNRVATKKICAHFGVKITDEYLFSGDGGATKEQNLLAIAAHSGADEIIFIEDSVHNLEEVLDPVSKKIRLREVLATWGYIGPEDKAHALKLGAELATQETVAGLLV